VLVKQRLIAMEKDSGLDSFLLTKIHLLGTKRMKIVVKIPKEWAFSYVIKGTLLKI
jgi:hypothetical protein